MKKNIQDGWARFKLAHFFMRDLQDVDVSTTLPAGGQALVWNSTDKRWEPGSPSTIESVNTVAASGSTQTLPDVTTATMHDITLTANCTFTFPAAGAGKSFSMRLAQDGTGSRTATWPAAVKWAGGTAPTLSTAANAVDALAFVCIDGSHYLGFFSGKGMA